MGQLDAPAPGLSLLGPAAVLALASDASWKEVSLKTNQEALNLQNGNCSGTSTIIHDFSLHLHHSQRVLTSQNLMLIVHDEVLASHLENFLPSRFDHACRVGSCQGI